MKIREELGFKETKLKNEEELKEEEIWKVVERMKKKKTTGIDEIPTET